MNMEPSQLTRGMDVDVGMGLGDELGGFEGFDTMFAEPNNTTDFFNFCALEEAQHEQDAATTSAFSSPPSPAGAFGQQQRGHGFSQESWNTGGQQQIQAWPSLTLSASEPSRKAKPSVLLQAGGKPRARKRHDEDEALEAAEDAFPMMKRRSSTSSMAMNAGAGPTPEAFEKCHSFSATPASGGWTPAASQQQATQGQQQRQQQQQQVGAARPSPPGGAIKVNTDVTSGTMRPPRISVFMTSSSRRRGSNGSGGSPRLSTPGGSYGGPSCQQQQHQLESTMDRTASVQAQRLKGLRITMRGRSTADKYVIDHNPAVVAMGSPHHPNSTSALLLGDDDHEEEDQFLATAAPQLRRASSVGALTIAGNGEILSTSPVLSATGTIIQSCELSDRVGDGGQRRNLVCKVFGSGGGSPYVGSANGRR
eukprot:g5708.t1